MLYFHWTELDITDLEAHSTLHCNTAIFAAFLGKKSICTINHIIIMVMS